MYIDTDDQLTQKIAQQSKQRGQQKKKSKFCTIQRSAALENYVQNIEDFPIFAESDQLKIYKEHFEARNQSFINQLDYIFKQEQSLENFASLHKKLGVLTDDTTGKICFRDYLPAAKEVYLFGDFNSWNKTSHSLSKTEQNGLWEIVLDKKPSNGSKLKLRIISQNGKEFIKNPTISKQLIFSKNTKQYDSIYTDSEVGYQMKSVYKPKCKSQKIYQVQLNELENGFIEFGKNMLPLIDKLGFNAIELIGLQEFESDIRSPLNPFAITTKYGSLDELKALIDVAHSQQIAVFMKISTFKVSVSESGLYNQDGTDSIYFHQLSQPNQSYAKFNYGKTEALQLSLSILNYFFSDFCIDGIITNQISNIIYLKDDLNFDGSLNDVFNEYLSVEAVVYVLLGNDLIHSIKPSALSFLNNNSGYPHPVKSIQQGGLGFDYQLEHQGVQISSLEQLHKKAQFYSKQNEASKCAGLIQNIDNLAKQSTINLQDSNILAYYKLSRFLTITMGSQFGFIYFVENLNTIQLTQDKIHLKIEQLTWLNNLFQELFKLDNKYQYSTQNISSIDMQLNNQLVLFEKGNLIFIMNCKNEVVKNFKITTKQECDHKILFNSDAKEFGGKDQYESYKNGIKVIKEIYKDRPFHFTLDIYPQTGIIIVPTIQAQFIEEEEEKSDQQ